jgi:hypothetical protein
MMMKGMGRGNSYLWIDEAMVFENQVGKNFTIDFSAEENRIRYT